MDGVTNRERTHKVTTNLKVLGSMTFYPPPPRVWNGFPTRPDPRGVAPEILREPTRCGVFLQPINSSCPSRSVGISLCLFGCTRRVFLRSGTVRFRTFAHDQIGKNPAISRVYWCRFVMLSSLLATVNSNIGSIFQLF